MMMIMMLVLKIMMMMMMMMMLMINGYVLWVNCEKFFQILKSHHRNHITNIAADEFGSEGMDNLWFVNGVLLSIHIFHSLQ